MKFSYLIVGFIIYFFAPAIMAETCDSYFSGSVVSTYLDSNLQPTKLTWKQSLKDYRKIIFFDFLRYDSVRMKQEVSRRLALKAIKKDPKLSYHYSSIERVIESHQMEIPRFERKFVSKKWEVHRLVDPDMPTQQIPVEQLKQKYKKLLSPPLYEAFSGIIDASNDPVQVYHWVLKVRESVFKAMWEDGLRAAETYANPRVREYYLDRVLAARAQAFGFQIDKTGLPINIYTFSDRAFFRTLSSGVLFLDWTGLELVNGVDGRLHLVRGHMLAMAYLAEHVPNYANFIKYIGHTRDRDGFWKMFSDNAAKNETPFYNTYWIHVFSDLLGIQY